MALTFGSAFKYPFNRWVGLFNILWLLVPIYGWFLFIGYRVRIVSDFLDGKYKELPTIAHGDDFVLGLQMFIKLIPAALVLIIGTMLLGAILPHRGGEAIVAVIILLIVPVLAMNFIKKRTVVSCFEFDLLKHVKNNFFAYVIALLKEICLSIVFLLLVVVLVGIPAGALTKSIYLAEFYRSYVK